LKPGVPLMMICIQKRHLFALGLVLCLLAGGGLLAALLMPDGEQRSESAAVWAPEAGETLTIVIDAGHGAEDGGAVAADGTVESGLNLEIALRTDSLFRFLGGHTQMVRQEDTALYSQEAQTLRQKKVEDLKNRVALVNELPRAVLISIHQNSLPSVPSVHGAQAFFNGVEGAQPLAESIQDQLNADINAGNEKKCKQVASSVYLMNQVTVPAILVECGFLSNSQETQQLKDPDYQKKLALAIAAGYFGAEAGGEDQA
jgi:N-acetylmuramoyl-L-alanine amidase